MPGLTVTEKDFWRTRIAARIDRRIEAIRAKHPALLDRMRRDAHAHALGSLGLAGPYAELEAIKAERATLARREKAAQRAMVASLRGVPIDEVPENLGLMYGVELQLPREAAEALEKRRRAHQEQLLRDDPVGREIAGLEAEKDRLLDTVWLATSPAQIKQLWSKVADWLGDEPSRLELEALSIEPAKEG